ncbi:hypothetical protein DUNSADRAFT_3027 [Dunaliella salina]|uniref:Encoded protein n=1 Tax=Dunaliella salina TaxID=3046 RepID=A0ABQ7FVQ5_DUNSA|nr:hypothetical protein DUNSADRAFT_3027 [Dunaliella salina]|eukprot:KAF5826461.1 hypothetical protein DUNSADRAFT_3027 [Dunaliella salina]
MEVEHCPVVGANKRAVNVQSKGKPQAAPVRSRPRPHPLLTAECPRHAKTLFCLVACDNEQDVAHALNSKDVVYPLENTLLQAGLTENEGALGLFETPMEAVLRHKKPSLNRARELGMRVKIARVLAWNASALDLPRRCPSLPGARFYSFVIIKGIEELPVTAVPLLAPRIPVVANMFDGLETLNKSREFMGAKIQRPQGPSRPTTSLDRAKARTAQDLQDVADLEKSVKHAWGIP